MTNPLPMHQDLVFPIYVDTNALLDLLASIEGGFTVVEKVTTRDATTRQTESELSGSAGTEFGVPNVLNLLKITLGGSLSARNQRDQGEERQSERYHTYGSLLYRLRTFLHQSNLIKVPYDKTTWAALKPSDFFEVHGVFRPNPLADSLQQMDRLITLAQLVAGLNKAPGTGKTAYDTNKQMRDYRRFLQGVLADIDKESLKTFVVEPSGPEGFSTVVLLSCDYLRHKTLAEIVHKEYRLLGKVVRVIGPDSEEVIDLLRGTGMGGVGRDLVNEFVQAINTAEGVTLPPVRVEISGPALEVVPIAVFI